MSRTVAKIAVSAATYWLDKPYDYLIPPEMAEKALPGMRVHVPFSRGNRRDTSRSFHAGALFLHGL